MAEITTDFNRQIADLQAAMKALWPGVPKVYFNLTSAALAGDPEGRVLTQEEQNALSRVAHAIGAARSKGQKEAMAECPSQP